MTMDYKYSKTCSSTFGEYMFIFWNNGSSSLNFTYEHVGPTCYAYYGTSGYWASRVQKGKTFSYEVEPYHALYLYQPCNQNISTYATYYIQQVKSSDNDIGDVFNNDNWSISWNVAKGMATGLSIVNIVIPILSVAVFLIASIVLLFMYALKQRMVHGRLRYVCRKSSKKWRCFRGRPRSYSAYLAHKAAK